MPKVEQESLPSMGGEDRQEAEKEPSPLQEWLENKPLNTRNCYGYWLRRLLAQMGTDETRIIIDAEKMQDKRGNIIPIWREAKHAANKLPQNGMKNGLNALRSYLGNLEIYCPEGPIKLKKKETTPRYLNVDQVHAVILASEFPFGQIFRLIFRSYMGAREFLSFNTENTWQKVAQAIENQEELHSNPSNIPDNPLVNSRNTPEKADYSINIREKPYFRFDYPYRKNNNTPFYTLIPLKTLKEITKIMNNGKQLPFTTRNGVLLDLGTPEDPRYLNSVKYLDKAFHEAVIQSKIETASASLHALRDSAKTYARTLRPIRVEKEAVDFVMGHTIDPLGYDQCWRDDLWMWEELSKVNPSLDAKDFEISER